MGVEIRVHLQHEVSMSGILQLQVFVVQVGFEASQELILAADVSGKDE